MITILVWGIVLIFILLGYLLFYSSRIDKGDNHLYVYILVGFLVLPSIISFTYAFIFGLYTLPEYLSYFGFMFILLSPILFLFTGINLLLRGRKFNFHGIKLLGYTLLGSGILALLIVLYILYFIND